jgi:hypothetical protein
MLEPRATVDAIGRYRLAEANPHERARGGRINIKTFLSKMLESIHILDKMGVT